MYAVVQYCNIISTLYIQVSYIWTKKEQTLDFKFIKQKKIQKYSIFATFKSIQLFT